MSVTPCCVEPRARRGEVVDLERDVVRETDRRARAGIGAAGAARRVRLYEKVELVVSDLEPRALEDEVARPRDFLEPERAAVEAARALEIGDDQPAVLEARAGTTRTLTRKETPMPLIRVELFDYRMSDETSAALIEKLTDALGEATHPGLKEHTWVIVEGPQPEELGSRGQALARRPDAAGARSS